MLCTGGWLYCINTLGFPSVDLVQKHLGLFTPPTPVFPVLGRLKEFKVSLLEVFREAHAQSVGMTRLTESVNRDKEQPFSSEEIQAALSKMQEDNQVMVSEGIIFLIWGGLVSGLGPCQESFSQAPTPDAGRCLYSPNNSVSLNWSWGTRDEAEWGFCGRFGSESCPEAKQEGGGEGLRLLPHHCKRLDRTPHPQTNQTICYK